MSLTTLTTFAPAVSAAIALVAFLFSVSDGFWSRRRESNRRDWERLQALAQVLHQGVGAGLWAQKLAIQELGQLKTKQTQALLLSKEVMSWWNKESSVDPTIKADLQTLITELSKQHRLW